MADKDTDVDGLTLTDLLKEGHPQHRLENDDNPEDPNLEKSEPSDDPEKDEPSEDEGKEDKPNLKYASHEDAEKAYVEAERAMHDANTRAAVAEAELKKLQAPEPVKEKDPFAEIVEEYTKKIEALKQEDPDLRKKTMEILVEQSLAVAKLQTEQGNKVATTRREDAKQKVAHIRVALKSAGLEKFESEFFDMAGSVPETITDFNEAVSWGIERVKKLVAKFGEIQSAEDKDKEEKERESFALGAAGRQGPSKTGGKKGEEKLPVSLAESMKALQKTRIIR